MQSEHEPAERSDSHAQELHNAHEAAAYNEWLAAEILGAIADLRPSSAHDEVMARMNARITQHKTAATKRT